LTSALPKPLLEVAGRPFVEHQLELLRRHGVHRVVLCVGYLGELIERVLGDGRRFGLELAYSEDGPSLAGTAGAIRKALPLLEEEFLVLYGDTYLRIDYADVARAFRASGLPALMTVLENRGAWGTSNAVYASGRVEAYDKRRPPAGAHWIDYGLLAFRREVFADPGPDDLALVTAELAARGALAGYPATERFYEIGSPAALAETARFLASFPEERPTGPDARRPS
jgi:NDP-sugar pyrophosphorylase family protein